MTKGAPQAVRCQVRQTHIMTVHFCCLIRKQTTLCFILVWFKGSWINDGGYCLWHTGSACSNQNHLVQSINQGRPCFDCLIKCTPLQNHPHHSRGMKKNLFLVKSRVFPFSDSLYLYSLFIWYFWLPATTQMSWCIRAK